MQDMDTLSRCGEELEYAIDRYQRCEDAACLLAQRLTLKGDAAYAAQVLREAGIEATVLVEREATGRD